MLRQRLSKLHKTSLSQQLSPNSVMTRAIPIVFVRNRTDFSSPQKKKTSTTEEPRTFNRRYVEVDTPFANANKYTYAMPEDAYVASEKVAKILELGTVDDAADYIKALPIYLQSPVVWNQLLGYCAKYGRANYAEMYYAQMRKRGLEPNDRTFTHLLTAYAKSNSPNAVRYAEIWLKKMQDFNIQPSTIHMNNLMRVYNKADQPEKTIEALKQMSTRGDLVPDSITYSIALQGCTNLSRTDRAEQVRTIWHEIIYRMERNLRSPSASLLSKKATEISWTESAIRSSSATDSDLEVDHALVIALLNAVTRTAATEHDVLTGLEVLDRLYSLCPPRAAEMMERNGLHRKSGFGFQPSVKVLDAILRFSGGLREYQLGQEYYQLALEQFPRLEPDQYVNKALAWLEKQTKRGHNFHKKKDGRSKRRE